MIKMTMLEYVMSLHEVCRFQSQEKSPGLASNSELRRMCDQSAFRINGKPYKAKEQIPFPITSVVMFPKSPTKRCTLL